MIRLNSGNLWTNRWLDKVIQLNKEHANIEVVTMFGSIGGLTPTARSIDRLPTLSWPSIEAYIAKAKDNDINCRYTLNQSVIGPLQQFKPYWENELKATLIHLHKAGIEEWTITSPLLISLLRDMFPDDFIEVSTIAEIACPEDAERYIDLGANGIDVSGSINRDFSALKDIMEVANRRNVVVEILANEACLWKCPFRRECYNLSSSNSVRGDEFFSSYPFGWCSSIRNNNPVEWIKARMILPQWMSFYQSELGINMFKVAFRTHPYELALPILEAYMSENFQGNYCDLWPTISKLASKNDVPLNISCAALDKIDFFQHWINTGFACTARNCDINCSYCSSILEKVICQ